jgi:hypothetical protein
MDCAHRATASQGRWPLWITKITGQSNMSLYGCVCLDYPMRDDERETEDHFVVMVVILFLLSAALIAVLFLFGGAAFDTHTAIR